MTLNRLMLTLAGSCCRNRSNSFCYNETQIVTVCVSVCTILENPAKAIIMHNLSGANLINYPNPNPNQNSIHTIVLNINYYQKTSQSLGPGFGSHQKKSVLST